MERPSSAALAIPGNGVANGGDYRAAAGDGRPTPKCREWAQISTSRGESFGTGLDAREFSANWPDRVET